MGWADGPNSTMKNFAHTLYKVDFFEKVVGQTGTDFFEGKLSYCMSKLRKICPFVIRNQFPKKMIFSNILLYTYIAAIFF